MLNIVLFGPPGVGKGTQAKRLVAEYGFNHISTGEVIRNEISSNSPIGRQIRECIERGELAPDNVVIDIIAKYVEEHRDSAGNIFDGFPRTIVQAQEFDTILATHAIEVDVMLSLEAPDQELVDRLVLRGQQSGRADDSSREIIHNRIKIYKAQTEIVAQFYAQQGKYIRIDGVGTMDVIFERLRTEIAKVQVRKIAK